MDASKLDSFNLSFHKGSPDAPLNVSLQAKAKASEDDLPGLYGSLKGQIIADPLVGGAPLLPKGEDMSLNQASGQIVAAFRFAPASKAPAKG